MVEKMNRSIEDVMKKLLENQGDWEDRLPLVLFLVGASRQSSTGISPFRLMFQHDPIHLFEFMDRLKHDGDENVNVCFSDVMIWKNSRVPNFLFPLTKFINYF